MFPLPVFYCHILLLRNSRSHGNDSVVLALAFSEVPLLANPGSDSFAGTVWHFNKVINCSYSSPPGNTVAEATCGTRSPACTHNDCNASLSICSAKQIAAWCCSLKSKCWLCNCVKCGYQGALDHRLPSYRVRWSHNVFLAYYDFVIGSTVWHQ